MYCTYLKIPYSEHASLEENLEDMYIQPIFSNAKSKHRVGIAILLMIILGGLSWYYVTNHVQHRSTIMEHLENLNPTNYLTNSENSDDKNNKTSSEE